MTKCSYHRSPGPWFLGKTWEVNWVNPTKYVHCFTFCCGYNILGNLVTQQQPDHWTHVALLFKHTVKPLNIRRTKSQNLNVSRLVLQLSFAPSIKARCEVKNEDVVGAAPTGDAPTTSEWSTILLATKVRLILEVWQWLSLAWHQSCGLYYTPEKDSCDAFTHIFQGYFSGTGAINAPVPLKQPWKIWVKLTSTIW